MDNYHESGLYLITITISWSKCMHFYFSVEWVLDGVVGYVLTRAGFLDRNKSFTQSDASHRLLLYVVMTRKVLRYNYLSYCPRYLHLTTKRTHLSARARSFRNGKHSSRQKPRYFRAAVMQYFLPEINTTLTFFSRLSLWAEFTYAMLFKVKVHYAKLRE